MDGKGSKNKCRVVHVSGDEFWLFSARLTLINNSI